MIKKTLLISVFCTFLSLTSFCQFVSAEKHQISTTVIDIPSLKSQAEKIDKKMLEINQAALSSRAILTKLKEELTGLNQEYLILLSQAITNANDPMTKTALEEEIIFVKQQLASKEQSKSTEL